MNLIKVFHSQDFRNTISGDEASVKEAHKSGKYQKVWEGSRPGKIETEDDVAAVLEQVYARTQNIEHSWNPTNPQRSTSVGDLISVNDKFYMVSFFGFDPVHL